MDDHEPTGSESQPVRTLPVLGGAVLGFAATWILLTIAILVLYGQQLRGAMEVVVPAGACARFVGLNSM